MERPGLESASIWDADTASRSLIHYATALAYQHLLFLLFLFLDDCHANWGEKKLHCGFIYISLKASDLTFDLQKIIKRNFANI